MLGLSDALNDLVASEQCADLRRVWRSLRRAGAPDRLRPTSSWTADPRVVSESAWREIRGSRSGRDVELDLIALLPAQLIANLDPELLSELGAGGRALARLQNSEERLECLRESSNLNSGVLRHSDAATLEAALQMRDDFYGPGALDEGAAMPAVQDFLALERRLHLLGTPTGRGAWDLNADLFTAHEGLERAAPGLGDWPFGVIRVKVLRATALRLSGRFEEALRELREATTDLVNARGSDSSWINLVDRVSEEWAYTAARTDGSGLRVIGWLYPQILRLAHSQPTPYRETVSGDSWVVLGAGSLRPSVVALGLTHCSVGESAWGSTRALLGAAACPLVRERAGVISGPELDQTSEGTELGDWQALTRWARAEWLRRSVEPAVDAGDKVLNAVETVSRHFIRLRSLRTVGYRPPQLSRWDEIRLDQSIAALTQVARPEARWKPQQPTWSAYRAPRPVNKQGNRAEESQRARTDQKLVDSLKNVWALRPDLTDPATLIAAVAAGSGVSKKTLQKRIDSRAGCQRVRGAMLLMSWTEAIDPAQDWALSDSVVDLLSELEEFDCGCGEPDGAIVRMVASRAMPAPHLQDLVGAGPRRLERAAIQRARKLRGEASSRWRAELEYAALHAACDHRPDDAYAHLAEAAADRPPARGEDLTTLILTFAALGDPSAFSEIVAALEADPAERNRYLSTTIRGLGFARDLGHHEVVRIANQFLWTVLADEASDASFRLAAAGGLALGTYGPGGSDNIESLVSVTSPIEPAAAIGCLGKRTVEAASAFARGAEEDELASLRACWDTCRSVGALTWSGWGLMSTDRIKRLLMLERTRGEFGDIRAVVVERYLASVRFRRWVDVLPASDWFDLGQMIAAGQASFARDLIELDQDDPDDGETLPSDAVDPLLESMAALTGLVVGLRDDPAVEAVKALITELSAGRVPPSEEHPERDCDEPWT